MHEMEFEHSPAANIIKGKYRIFSFEINLFQRDMPLALVSV